MLDLEVRRLGAGEVVSVSEAAKVQYCTEEYSNGRLDKGGRNSKLRRSRGAHTHEAYTRQFARTNILIIPF
jgi:hypothetical protein